MVCPNFAVLVFIWQRDHETYKARNSCSPGHTNQPRSPPANVHTLNAVQTLICHAGLVSPHVQQRTCLAGSCPRAECPVVPCQRQRRDTHPYVLLPYHCARGHRNPCELHQAHWRAMRGKDYNWMVSALADGTMSLSDLGLGI